MAEITTATRVHRNTISNWRNENPASASELLNATRERELEFRDRAEALVPKAIRVLDSILENEKASPSVCLRAALAVLKMAQSLPTLEPAEAIQNPEILHNPAQTPVRRAVGPARNTISPCGSGLKYKRRCALKPLTAMAA